MRVLIGADATKAIETSSDEFRTLVLGAIFSDVVTGSAFADNLDLLEDAIEDSRNEKLKGFSQQGLVKEMRKVVKDVDKQPIGKLLRGQKFYKKFDIGSDDEIEKPFEELTLDEILDDEKIKRLLGFRQMQRPPEIEAGTDGFITSNYLKKAIKRNYSNEIEGGFEGEYVLSVKLSESQTSSIDGSKVDYLQKEGYSPYLTPVTKRKINLYNESRDRVKDDGLHTNAFNMLVSKFKKEVKEFSKVKDAKEDENFEDYSIRIKNSVSKDLFNFLISNAIKEKILLEIFYLHKQKREKVNEGSERFEGMTLSEIIRNPDVFIQKVYPTDYNLYDMTLEIESKKTVFKVKLVGEKTHGLFETGLVSGKGKEDDYTSIGRSLPLGTQRKGSDYRRKLRDFAAVIRNNYLELMEV
tara:strand:- start:1226 stop:2455 length:1230 start_codon:yes stop_codon:yes gene_type:complete